MEFKEKYISSEEAIKANPDKKVVLSNDAYAISEMINELTELLIKNIGRLFK